MNKFRTYFILTPCKTQDHSPKIVPTIYYLALKARGSKPKSLSPSGTSRTSPKMNTPSQDETLNTLAEDEWRPRVTLPVLESTADPADWQLEVERVLPHLRVTVRADSKDWRVHQEEMHKHRSEIDRIQSECRTQLSRLQTELGRALDKISSREKYMNGQLEPILLEFKSTQVCHNKNTSPF